jgi:CheY-like chemotaxis protein
VASTRTKKYWGTQRVARVCQVSPATVASWIDAGHLKGHKTPTGRRRVESDDLVDFLRSHGMAVPSDLLTGGHSAKGGGGGGGGGREAVVVVEDDPSYLRALVRSLEAAEVDLDVVQAVSGMDALLEIGRVQPNVIVLDYRLPDLNAVQVVQRLLEPGRQLDAEILIVTGGMPAEAQAELRQVGVRTIINKVDGLQAVVDAVRRALQGRRKVA